MRTITISILSIALACNVFASAPSFEEAVNETLTMLHTAEDQATVLESINHLERIAGAEGGRWEAQYHLAYARTTLSWWETDGKLKDMYLDQAEKELQRSIELEGDLSELHTLQAYIHQARIQVSSSRGRQYSQMADESVSKALAINPNNPRAHLLKAQNVYYTPKIFGGGCKRALPHYQKAIELFGQEDNSMTLPRWGQPLAEQKVGECSGEE